ncbi:MAG: acyl carrier protein [Solirubrobacteraceae bacterium]
MSITTSKEQIEERLTEALVEFGAEPSEVSRAAEFEALDVDSLDLVEMAQIVEEEWGVEITGEDMKGLKTFGDAIDLVVARLS